MSVYDLPHITVEVVLNGAYYRIRTEEGWVISCPTYDENIYKTVGFFPATYDFSTVEIIAIADLPEGAEICGDGATEPEHEVQ